MTHDHTLVEAYLRDAAYRRNHDLRYDVLLEIGYLLDFDERRMRSWCNVLRIGKTINATSISYYAHAFVDRRDVLVFFATIDDDGAIEWGVFQPDHWRTDLTNWYAEEHSAALLAIPRIGP